MTTPDPYGQPRSGWDGNLYSADRSAQFSGRPSPGESQLGYPRAPADRSSSAKWAVIGGAATLLSLVLAFLAWQYPRSADPQPTSMEGRAPYIAQVDAICQQAAPGIVNLGSPPADPVAGITWYAEQAQLHRELLTAWANVRYPEEDDALIRQILDPLEQSVTRLSYASQALAQGGLQLANEHIGKAGDLRSEYRSKARAYGFQVCYAL